MQMEFYQILKLLSKDEMRMICINGEIGSGKTRMVAELARYLVIRNTFPDGVYYMNFLKADTLKDINDVLINVAFDKLMSEEDGEVLKGETSIDL